MTPGRDGVQWGARPPPGGGSPFRATEGHSADHVATRRFRPDLSEIGHARRFVRTELGAWGVPGCSGDFELATSELVTNAIVHGEGAVDVTVSLCGDRLRLEVADHGNPAGAIRPQVTAPAGIGGWGLRFIGALSDSWGALRVDEQTQVWMERRVGRP